jgi:hypothetical protein
MQRSMQTLYAKTTSNWRRILGATYFPTDYFLASSRKNHDEKTSIPWIYRNYTSVDIVTHEIWEALIFWGEQRKLRYGSKNIGSSPNTCLNLLIIIYAGRAPHNIIIYAGRAPHNMQIRDMCSVYIDSLCHNNCVRFSNLWLQIEVIVVTAHAFTSCRHHHVWWVLRSPRGTDHKIGGIHFRLWTDVHTSVSIIFMILVLFSWFCNRLNPCEDPMNVSL